MYNHRRHLTIATLLVIASTFVVYLLTVQAFPLFISASAEGDKVALLFQGHYWVIAFLFSLVTVFLLYATVVFRKRPEDPEDITGEYMHGNTALEIAWTIAPVGLVLVFAVWGSNMLIDITARDYDPVTKTGTVNGQEAWVVGVRGFKWGWAYTYPDGSELSSLVVPKNVPVILEMESDDIIHSFWIPEFLVKQDLLPGDKYYLRFTPTMTNEEMVNAKFAQDGEKGYSVQVRCAEICGTRHSYMLSNVWSVEGGIAGAADRVVEIANDIPELAVDRGEFWYTEYGCNACHSLDGELDGYNGPTWKGIYERDEELEDGSVVVADDAYLRDSIYNPNNQIVAGYPAGVMPQNFEQQFTDKQNDMAANGRPDIDIVGDLIEFMKTLE